MNLFEITTLAFLIILGGLASVVYIGLVAYTISKQWTKGSLDALYTHLTQKGVNFHGKNKEKKT